jgi:hypothetical protein
MFTDEARFGRMNRPRPCWAFWAPDLRSPSSSFATTSTYTEQVCPEGWNVHLSDHEAIEYECFQIFLNAPESLRNPKPASQLSLHLAPNPASRPCRRDGDRLAVELDAHHGAVEDQPPTVPSACCYRRGGSRRSARGPAGTRVRVCRSVGLVIIHKDRGAEHRKATSISLLVVISVHADGRKVLLAIKSGAGARCSTIS